MDNQTLAFILLGIVVLIESIASSITAKKVKKLEERMEYWKSDLLKIQSHLSDRITNLEIKAIPGYSHDISRDGESRYTESSKYPGMYYSVPTEKEIRSPYCLYCGTRIESDFKDLCPKCGAPLPRGKIHDGGSVSQSMILATGGLDFENAKKYLDLWSSK
jgi:hypothetical protein